MPSGVANEWMQGIQLGSNIMGSRLDRDARMQELKSRDAARRAEEARAAKLLDLKMQEYNMQVQKAADVEKATTKFNWLRSPFIPTSSGNWIPNPHKMDDANAMMSSFLPLADTPDKAAKIINEASMMRDRDTRQKTDAAKPFSKLGELQADLERYKDNPMISEALTKEINNYRDTEFAPSETQKMLNELNRAQKAGDHAAVNALNKKLGIDGLSVEQRIAFRAELDAIENNIKLMDKPVEKAKMRQAAYDKFGVKGIGESPTQAPQSGPKVGDVVKGYKFNGKFPPGDKRAWDKI